MSTSPSARSGTRTDAPSRGASGERAVHPEESVAPVGSEALRLRSEAHRLKGSQAHRLTGSEAQRLQEAQRVRRQCTSARVILSRVDDEGPSPSRSERALRSDVIPCGERHETDDVIAMTPQLAFACHPERGNGAVAGEVTDDTGFALACHPEPPKRSGRTRRDPLLERGDGRVALIANGLLSFRVAQTAKSLPVLLYDGNGEGPSPSPRLRMTPPTRAREEAETRSLVSCESATRRA